MRLLYTFLWYLLLPLLFARLWWRGRRAPAYRARWRERLALGYRPGTLRDSVWIHAVSVGETLAAAPLIEALMAAHPRTPLVITTTTPTGSERVRALFGDRVTHVYCPWELPGAYRRFLRAFDPKLVAVMETELWPNLCAAADAHGAALVLMNGRLSEKSYRGYARLPALVRPMLARFQVLAVQTAVEAERFAALGAPRDRLRVNGSIKFDLALDAPLRDRAAALRGEFGGRPVWIAASTHPGEDEIVLAAHRRLLNHLPGVLLVLVPRHPERFGEVAALARGMGFTVARRSEQPAVTDECEVYLADTMGELMMLYGACDVALVGGSLVPVGGHNLLEPAAWGVPVLSGPQLHNFTAIAALLNDAGALAVVNDEGELAERLERLLADAGERRRLGEAAAAVVAANRGALQRGVTIFSSLWPSRSGL
ncbi:3-deoxy-D-manno-octulosonic acid transferase [Alcanivorax sp. N3-2A]|nr:3-deoxy-D-manno-octulosonic acid transferase [Alcanivorax sp. N3-2A]|tara:strand:- start:26080 stop:27357 length:1278 start_codon:yes stop_codon:yes gene_type:complete